MVDYPLPDKVSQINAQKTRANSRTEKCKTNVPYACYMDTNKYQTLHPAILKHHFRLSPRNFTRIYFHNETNKSIRHYSQSLAKNKDGNSA